MERDRCINYYNRKENNNNIDTIKELYEKSTYS